MPNRDITYPGRLAAAGTGSLAGALDAVREGLQVEIREDEWTWEVDGEPVSFAEFRRADAPGATGKFRGTALNGIAYVEASL